MPKHTATKRERCVAPIGSRRCKRRVAPTADADADDTCCCYCAQHRRLRAPPRDCPCCLGAVVPGAPEHVHLECGHDFHFECIRRWVTTLQRQPTAARTCPMCRAALSPCVVRLLDYDLDCRALRSEMQAFESGHVVWPIKDAETLEDLVCGAREALLSGAVDAWRNEAAAPTTTGFEFRTPRNRRWRLPASVSAPEQELSWLLQSAAMLTRSIASAERCARQLQRGAWRMLGRGREFRCVCRSDGGQQRRQP